MIQEPGVQVFISGQEVPPPLPPLRAGIGMYVLGFNGPMKLRRFTSTNNPYTHVNPHQTQDINYLTSQTPIWGQLLPHFGWKPAALLVEGVSAAILPAPTHPSMFFMPTWLTKPPTRLYAANATVNAPNITVLGIVSINSNPVYYSYVHSSGVWGIAYLYDGTSEYQLLIRRVATAATTTTFSIMLASDSSSPTASVIVNLSNGSLTRVLTAYGGAQPYNIYYFYPTKPSVSLRIEPTTTPNAIRQIVITEGSSTSTIPFHTSPTSPYYIGFIRDDRFEVVKCGPGITPGSSGNFWHYNYGSTSVGYGDALLDPDGAFVIRASTAAHYTAYLNNWHNAILYHPSDPRPIHEDPPPLEVDYVLDGAYYNLIQSAHISNPTYNDQKTLYATARINTSLSIQSPFEGYHEFIGSLGKFIFKVHGMPRLDNIPTTPPTLRKNVVDAFLQWSGLNSLGGFHRYLIQGHTGTVSAAAVYLRAVIDYDYKAIFGISRALSISQTDHIFPKTTRETFLTDYRLNCIVRDQVTGLWYINNNLTQEALADASPLGEECNARVAVKLTKLLGRFVERYIGMANTAPNRARVTEEINSFITNFNNLYPSNLVAWRVICDETNNTPTTIANNELHIRVEARFGKSIKYITIYETVLIAT